MGELKINENVVANVSLLAAASVCAAAGGGTIVAFGLFAAPAMELTKAPLKKFLDKFKTKDPENYSAIARIQTRINETLTGDQRFIDCAPALIDRINDVLPRALSQSWPPANLISSLAKKEGGFPSAIADHILADFQKKDLIDDSLVNPLAEPYLRAVIEAAIKAAILDKTYFAAIEPQILMDTLGMTGAIMRRIEQLNTPIARIEADVSEILQILKADQLSSPEADPFIRRTCAVMLSSSRDATQLAVADLMADPANPQAATSRLKQAIAERSEARLEATEGEIELLKEVAAINYYINGEEAMEAFQQILKLNPNDASSWNQLGHLNRRLGFLDNAMSNYEKVLALGCNRDEKTLQAIAHCNLGLVTWARGDLDEAVDYFKRALTIEKGLGNKQGIANNYGNLGIIAEIRGNLDRATSYFEKALYLNEGLRSKEGKANQFGNLGNVAKIRGDLDRAVDYYEKSLAIEIELDHQEGMANVYGNLGIVAEIRGNLDEAVEYYEKALHLNKELGRAEGMACVYGNLGVVAQARGDLNGAENFHEKALALDKKLGRKEGIASTYGNLGIIARIRGNLDGAVDYYEKALCLNKELGRKEGIAGTYCNLGCVAEIRGDIEEARAYWEQALTLYQDIGARPMIEQVGGWLDALE